FAGSHSLFDVRPTRNAEQGDGPAPDNYTRGASMRTFILLSLAGGIPLASSMATPFPSEDVRVLCSFEKEEMAGKGWKTEAWNDEETIRVTGICSSTANTFGLLRKRGATHGRWALWERYDRGGGPSGGYPNRFFVEPRGKETERLSSYNSLLSL